MKPLEQSPPEPDAPASEIVSYFINEVIRYPDSKGLWKNVTFTHMERLVGHINNLRRCGVVFTPDLLESLLLEESPPPLEGNPDYEKINDYLNRFYNDPSKLESW